MFFFLLSPAYCVCRSGVSGDLCETVAMREIADGVKPETAVVQLEIAETRSAFSPRLLLFAREHLHIEDAVLPV